MKNLIKSSLLMLILLFTTATGTLAQQPSAGYWTLKIGGKPTYTNKNHHRMNGFVGLDITRRLGSLWEVGLGYAAISVIYPKPDGQGWYVSDTIFSHRFDAIANFHFLPLMLNEKPERLDLYVATRVGVTNFFTDFDKKADFFGGLGAAYYFTKNIGAYGEFGWQPLFKGNIDGVDLKNWRLGVAIRF
ncbi:MAG: porin family protein [Bacteroidia bacterium]|jgi:hypothetical protein|nr:porin family protein [Bacteroidia bacterium]